MFRFDWFAYFIGHDHATRPWGGVWHTDAQLRFNVDYLHILNNKWTLCGYIMTYSNIVYNMKNAADLGYKSTFDYFYKRNIVILGAGAFYNFNKKLMFHASIWTQVKTPLLLSDNNMVSYGFTIGFDYKFNVFL